MIEKKKNKYFSLPLLIVGSIIFGYAGYMVNGAWEDGIEFVIFMNRLTENLSYPLNDYYNEHSPIAVIVGVFIFWLFLFLQSLNKHNLMPGKEFGTARFGDSHMLTKTLKGENEDESWQLSEHVSMNIDDRVTKFNSNILCIGGSGSGKSYRHVIPNILRLLCSFFITDPKGELFRKLGGYLQKNGYQVKVLNLVNMAESFCYNPFAYIMNLTHIQSLVTNIMENTTPKDTSQGEAFWKESVSMFLESIFIYVWMVMPPLQRTMRSVMKLLGEAEVQGNGKKSKLDIRMEYLAETSELGTNHPAYVQYKKCMGGAQDTVKSIIISANARLAKFENEDVLRLFDKDEMNLEELGVGVNGDGMTKTALFCVIPDSDTTYNFIVGMLYTQAFQILYDTSKQYENDRLPLHVAFMMDEFANVALPNDFTKLISTMRGRNISTSIILQNLAQLKALFKDSWETITGNCDTTIYLGGNEQSTHEYISKMLGKATIEKRSTGESKGRQGSSSKNYDVIGRELLSPDEVQRLDNDKCLVMVRGQYPIYDDKVATWKLRQYKETADGGGEPVDFEKIKEFAKGCGYLFLSEESVEFLRKKHEGQDNFYMETLSYDEFMSLDEGELDMKLIDRIRESEMDIIHEGDDGETDILYVPDEKTDESDVQALIRQRKETLAKENLGDMTKKIVEGEIKESLDERLKRLHYDPEQLKEIERARQSLIPEEYILTYAYPDTTVVKMIQCRFQYGDKNKSQKGL